MIPGSQGCLAIIESAFPFGNSVVSCQSEIDQIAPLNWGRVCVGPGGLNTCVSASTPVDHRTWGTIKAQYRPYR